MKFFFRLRKDLVDGLSFVESNGRSLDAFAQHEYFQVRFDLISVLD